MIRLVLKSILFTLLVPGVIAVLIPFYITDGIKPNGHVLSLLGMLCMLSGFCLYGWCVWDFILSGKGTPAPVDPPRYLVRTGLYCYTRNPMYLAVFCFILGWILLYFNLSILLYSLCVLISLQLLVVFYEEPKLRELFGTEYDKYKKSVSRWLSLPGVRVLFSRI